MKPETTTPAAPLTAPHVSVVVPVFDEAAVLWRSLARLVAQLERLQHPFELICVDDGSRDGSAGILAAAAAADARLRTLSFPRNRGKGAAVRAGVLAARGELVLFCDADLSTDLAATAAVLAQLELAPVVFASRRAPGARIARAQSWPRRVLGRGFSRLAALAAAHPPKATPARPIHKATPARPARQVHDVTCGFKGFTRAAARDLFGLARVNGWAFDAELLAIAAARGWNVLELGVPWRDTDGSKVRVPAAVLRSSLDLALIAWRRRTGVWTSGAWSPTAEPRSQTASARTNASLQVGSQGARSESVRTART